MHALKFISIAILFCFFVTLFLVFIYPRYYILGVSRTGTDIAEEIAEHKRSPEECNNILDFDPFPSPSAQEQSNLCVYVYAELMKDPFACDLLMPSEYGLACLSNLWLQALPDDGCGWSITEPKIFECRHGEGFLLRSTDCKDFVDSEKQFSACIYFFAMREKSLTKCSEIPDTFIQSLCTTKMNAWLKYPELRGSFYFGKNSIE